MMGELHPEARSNVSVAGFGPVCHDRWCAYLRYPEPDEWSGHLMVAFYEPAARVTTLETGFSWPLERHWRAAVRESAKQLLKLAGLQRGWLRYDDEDPIEIDDRYDPPEETHDA